MADNYKHLIQKLKDFKKRYYLIKVIQGLLLFLSLIILYTLILLVAEINLFLKPEIKIVIFFSTLVFACTLVFVFFIIPLLKLFQLYKGWSLKQVAEYLTNTDLGLDDSLINILELAEEESNSSSRELVLASIDQKIKKLKVFDFNNALNLKSLKRFGLHLLIVVVIFFSLFIVFKESFYDSAARLIDYQSEYIKPAPFEFVIKNENLNVKKGSGIKIEVELKGRKIPEVLFISFGGNRFLMEKKETVFSYTIENVNNSFSFYFVGDTYYSKQFKITVLPVPIIQHFNVEIISPSYTNIENQELENVGDLKVVHGAKIKWKFVTYETKALEIVVNDSIKIPVVKTNDGFIAELMAKQKAKYSISIQNEIFDERNILTYSIDVIPDLYPEIEVVQIKDSVNYFRYFFKGHINDDYGFSDVKFRIQDQAKDSMISVQILKSLKEQEFYFSFDFQNYREKAKSINYYFSVYDNDAVSGFKETSSNSFTLVFPDKQEISKTENEGFHQIEDLMDAGLKLNQEIKKDLNDLKRNETTSKYSEWEKQQKVKEIVEKRKTLEDVLNQISEKNKELNNYSNAFSEQKKEMLEKQKQIEDLLNDVLSDELKKLFEEFNKLAQEYNSKKMEELTSNLDDQLGDLSKQLERNLEMLKRMKVTQKLEQIIAELYKLSANSKNRAEELKELKNCNVVIEKDSIDNQDFGNLKTEFDEILNFNKELKKPIKISDFDFEFNEISNQYKSIGDYLQRQRKRPAQDGLIKNGELLENLAFSIKQQLNANRRKQAYEDLNNIRQILDNLVYLSVEQEKVMKSLKEVQSSDPMLKELRIKQVKIIDYAGIVKDSLYALANRNEKISGVVNKELLGLQSNAKEASNSLNEGDSYKALVFQQNAMASINSLALFISEVLKNAENDLSDSSSGDEECNKPGKGKKQNLNMLKDSQEAIKQQLQKMIEQMKSGSSKGMNEQLGKTIAQQELMQQLIREMLGDSEVGSGAKEQLKQIDQLIEKNKIDLMTKRVTTETINRQNAILDRLLKAEISDRERDYEQEREAKTAEEKLYSNPKLFFEYKKNVKSAEDEIIRNNFKLSPYYDKKFKQYRDQLHK